MKTRFWAYVLRHKRMVILAPCAVVVLLAAGYFGRGIWRSNILPTYASWRHASALEATHTTELGQLNQDIKSLGMSLGSARATANCDLDIAIRWHTSVFCSTFSKGNSKTFAVRTEGSKAGSTQVQAQLIKHGWELGSDIDAQQLLYGSKQVDGFDCHFELSIDGDGKRVTPRLLCYHGYYYFGDPYRHL